ncbi:MAG: hypothetical protein A3H45_14525 [Ignavibacteria bacterium RIFCSPLOWO2_02_FULL_55_14]|nr:MAG: hypothetical protein A3H45_14525 [Ignavibacteria bacterium RIFCSPLOWO2_02_FULL_55_14]
MTTSMLLRRFLLCILPCVLVAQPSREESKVFPLSAKGRVIIDTYKGSIDVSTWDKPEVEVHVRIVSDGHDRRHEEEKVQDTRIRFDADDDIVRIKTDYRMVDKSWSFFDLFDGDDGTLPMVHYTIKMPARAQLKVKDYKSESTIAGLRSDLEFESYKGELSVTDHHGAVDLETYKGDIDVEFADIGGASRFETYKGTIVVRVPDKEGFSLRADLGRRVDLDTNFPLERHRDRRNRDDERFRTDVNGGGPDLSIKSEKGNIRLRSM